MTNFATDFRPTSLDEFAGHFHVKEVIENGFKLDRMPASVMLYGQFSTGKTTLARIVANMWNSEVIEINAADKTSIDDVRQIIDMVKYKPKEKEFITFIIDECHMLSKSAFDAFLKILEEPPKWAKFTLCTTNILKVPMTIRSRCINFHLYGLTIEEKKEILSKVSDGDYFCKEFTNEFYNSYSIRELLILIQNPINSNNYYECIITAVNEYCELLLKCDAKIFNMLEDMSKRFDGLIKEIIENILKVLHLKCVEFLKNDDVENSHLCFKFYDVIITFPKLNNHEDFHMLTVKLMLISSEN